MTNGQNIPMKENGDPLLEYMLDREDSCCFIVPDHVLWDETFHLSIETHNIAGIFYLDIV